MPNLIDKNFQMRTKRLVVRLLQESDFEEYKRAHSFVEKKKNRWDLDPMVSCEKELRSFFKCQLKRNAELMRKDTHYTLYGFDKKSGAMVGMVTVMDISRNIFQNGYIGYRILNNYWRQGFGKELTKAMIKISFKELGLHRLEAGIGPTDIRSIRLAKSLGFRKEGKSLRRLHLDGQWKDMMIYALTKEDLN